MKTRDFLLRYAYIYLYAASICILIGYGTGNAALSVSQPQNFSQRPTLIIDAGHGGIDGGTSSSSGTIESDLNLQIAKRLEALTKLWGYPCKMTRQNQSSIATEGETIREQKRSDLKNRIKEVMLTPNPVLISIHQNYFPDAKYCGPQVFFNGQGISQALSEHLQDALNNGCWTGSSRIAKQVQNVYMMQQITTPGILVECGFLSHPEESMKLQTPEYQKKLCCTILGATMQFLEKRQPV